MTTTTDLTELLASQIDLDADFLAVIDGSQTGLSRSKKAFIASLLAAAMAPLDPGGRLTLASNTPVMTADATAQTSVYYAPFKHARIPIWTGVMWIMRPFAQLTMALDTTNQTSTNIYDLFVWNNSGTVTIGAGPAWSSSTARGTGAGTTELELKDGIWTNKVSITLKNGAGAGTAGVAANTATYVGSVYCTANGQTGMAFKPAAANGGTNNILGLYNAYNRERVEGQCRDTTGGTDYSYNSLTWRAAKASTSNRISWLDGLQQSAVRAVNIIIGYSPNSLGAIGVALNSTTATPNVTGNGGITAGSNTVVDTLVSDETFLPQIGFNYLQRMEATNGVAYNFSGSATGPTRQNNNFTISLMM
jgi:hypothetical protein